MYAQYDWQYPDEGDIIKFRLVMTNNGGHYNTSESVFTCPINGTYYFFFNLYTGHLSNGESTSGLLKMDEGQLTEAYCDYEGSGHLRKQCGNSVVTHCNQGQHVYVSTAYSNTQLYGGAKRSTFSGFVINADVHPY